MIYEIKHEIKYKYSKPVFFDPHSIYLRPRENGAQALTRFKISIEPKPVLQSWITDVFGNALLRIWFDQESDFLSFKTEARVHTKCTNPFDYLPENDFLLMPGQYPREIQSYFEPYSQRQFEVLPVDVVQFSEQIAARCGSKVLSFLPELCHEIYQNFKLVNREQGEALDSATTLARKEGACRDLAMLFIACCKAQNLAARFVSGYYEGDSSMTEKDLHAWVEVYIVGGGWRGFDPSTGLAVNETYVPLAAAPKPYLISPTRGTFRGTGVTSKLLTKVSMTAYQTKTKKVFGKGSASKLSVV